MTKQISRRSAIQACGAVAAGVLFRTEFAAAKTKATAEQAAAIMEAPVGMELTITAATDATLRISIAAVDEVLDTYYDDGAIAPRRYPSPALKLRTDAEAREIAWGRHTVRVSTGPLRVAVKDAQGAVIQE